MPSNMKKRRVTIFPTSYVLPDRKVLNLVTMPLAESVISDLPFTSSAPPADPESTIPRTVCATDEEKIWQNR